jgi:hypothetical protein
MIKPHRTVRTLSSCPDCHCNLLIVEHGKLYHFDPHGPTVIPYVESFCKEVCANMAELEYGGNAYTLNTECALSKSLQGEEPFCVLWCCCLAMVLCLNPERSLMQVMDYYTLKTPDDKYLRQKVFHFSSYLIEFMQAHTPKMRSLWMEYGSQLPTFVSGQFATQEETRQQLLADLQKSGESGGSWHVANKLVVVAPPTTTAVLGNSEVSEYYMNRFGGTMAEPRIARTLQAIWAKGQQAAPEATPKVHIANGKRLVDKLAFCRTPWAQEQQTTKGAPNKQLATKLAFCRTPWALEQGEVLAAITGHRLGMATLASLCPQAKKTKRKQSLRELEKRVLRNATDDQLRAILGAMHLTPDPLQVRAQLNTYLVPYWNADKRRNKLPRSEAKLRTMLNDETLDHVTRSRVESTLKQQCSQACDDAKCRKAC